MNKVSANDIRVRLRNLWPAVGFLWLPDEIYTPPAIDEVVSILPFSGVAKKKFDGELFDCDDYSLSMNAFVHEYRRTQQGANYQWSFGEVFGTKFRRVEQPHTINICVAIEGVFFIEPQTYEIWPGSRENDQPLIIKI